MPTVARRPRDLAKEQFWRRMIRLQRQTDLLISAFCRGEGLKIANFHWWRRELNRRDQRETTSPPGPSTKGINKRPVAPIFLPVRVVEADFAPLTPAPPIEILLRDGLILKQA